MSVNDDEQDDAAARWYRKAEHDGLRCARCNEIVTYDDREQFFVTGMCSYHADQEARDG